MYKHVMVGKLPLICMCWNEKLKITQVILLCTASCCKTYTAFCLVVAAFGPVVGHFVHVCMM